MKTLVVLCRSPFSSKDGGTYAIRSTLRKLAAYSEVFLAGFGSEFDQPVLGGIQSCGSLGIAKNTISGFIKSLATHSPYSIAKYADRPAVIKLREIVAKHVFDVIWYEQTQAASASYLGGLLQGENRRALHILRSHNVEYRIVGDRTDLPYEWLRGPLSIEARKLQRAELEILSLMDHVYTISTQDRDILIHDSPVPLKNISYLPVPLETKMQNGEGVRIAGNNVLFVGNCRWRPNRDAANWIISRLAPCVEREIPQIYIRIIGTGSDELRPLICTNNIECVGFVSDLQREYREAICALAPIRSGSGINIKVLEALEFGVPVVGTNFARRGIDLAGYLPDDDEEEYVSRIGELAHGPAIAEVYSRSIRASLERRMKSIDSLWENALSPR